MLLSEIPSEMIKFIPMFILFLILIVCTNGIVGGGGGAHQEPDDQQHQHDKKEEGSSSHKEVDDDHTEKQYVIECAITFEDGGEALIERNYKLNGHTYENGQFVPIEKILAEVHGITGAEYIKAKEDKRDLKDIVDAGAKLHFPVPINKIKPWYGPEGQRPAGSTKVNERVDEKEALVKKKEKEIDFLINAGHVDIKSLVEKLTKVDWRWQFYNGVAQKGSRVFMVFHPGHSMVTISEKVGKTEDKKEHLKEVARFHFNEHGLNLYKKNFYNTKKQKEGTNFIVKQNKEEITETQNDTTGGPKRYHYAKDGFPKPLLTRKISIAKMKEIGLKVIGGRKLGVDFRCRHFAYLFIRSIVSDKSLADLDSIDKWPENLSVIDQKFITIDGSYAFKDCLNFDYNDWVNKHLDKDGNVKNVDKSHEHEHQKDDVGASDDRKEHAADHPNPKSSRAHG